ncbi:MAG: hypothetical protein IKM00_03715, partial [Clostridia bacterium]|nr:hypothetical protein [Clostridia bacterium]
SAIPQRTASGATPLRQANCSALCAGVRAERVGFAVYNSHMHQRSNGTFVCFFLQLFLSNKEKVDRFPLYQRGISYKKPRLFTEQKHSFCFKIFEYEKSYLFHIQK